MKRSYLLLGAALISLTGCAGTLSPPQPQPEPPPSKCPGTPGGVPVDPDGCPLDYDIDGVANYLDQCPYTPAGLPVNVIGCAAQNMVLEDVNFKFDSAELTNLAKATLDDVADQLMQNTSARILLEGHTDSFGTEAYNLELSQRRIDSVKAYLVSQGFPSINIRAVGYGESRPIATNDTSIGRALNRRVELGEWK
ncbi:OmpA family protein [Halomonas elongata]|uniref:OmpA family protein n=1 Tax=Halomonas elongata TaxID=2746 RepID=UPI00255B1F95|nr:OmpA family protein [Halomonas elongata]MDL4860722.1 OmpA family protein [Halomonas elongata]